MEISKHSLDAYLLSNYADEELTIEKMTSDFLTSKTRFYVRVKRLTGNSPSVMLMHFRLCKAEFLLVDGVVIEKVAFAVGFKSFSYFNKCFKDVFGFSPKRYIELLND